MTWNDLETFEKCFELALMKKKVLEAIVLTVTWAPWRYWNDVIYHIVTFLRSTIF